MRRSSADQRAAEPLDRLVVEIAGVDAAQRLALHQLAQELDQRQHELRQSAFHGLGVGVAQKRPDHPHEAASSCSARSLNEKGASGPT